MKSLFESEIGALRSELNQNITAMVSNESFCAGASVALISFAFAKQGSKLLSGAAGMAPAYDFIYSYTSRLLHATPMSFHTDKKNLEMEEMETFLEYSYVTLLDLIETSEELVRT